MPSSVLPSSDEATPAEVESPAAEVESPVTAEGSARNLIETFDPRTGDLLGVVPEFSAAEVHATVARARSVAPAWAALTYRDRTRHLLTVRDRLLDRAEELVEIICAETGKQRVEAVTTELMAVCETISWYAKHGGEVLATKPVPAGMMAHKKAWKSYSPVGVVGVISPWNYPFTLSMTPLLTALFAGNPVVLKPSEVTPTVGLAIGELFKDDEWPDLVQIVTGGGVTGEALVKSGVDKIAFTGSAKTGRRVMAAAAENLTPVLLELGGKDPMIVCADADLERAARGAVWGAFQNSGQTCMSVERVYVDESVASEFIDLVVELASQVRQNASGGDIGSMTFEPQLKIVEDHIADAVKLGATVLLGGKRIERDGLWFEPTVLVDVDHSMKIMTDETFGPVLPIAKFSEIDEALTLANDSEYGLNSSVWTSDLVAGAELAEQLEAGNVCVNDCIVSYAITGLPFGGVKSSGIGRVHGPEGLLEFSQVKSVMSSRIELPREAWWYPIPRNMDKMSIRALRLKYGTARSTKLKGIRRGH
ncbi:MAG: aldehyde dehydrogenase family protein [Microthrixaceae bacterium]